LKLTKFRLLNQSKNRVSILGSLLVLLPGVVHQGNAECDEDQVEEVVVAGRHDHYHQKNLNGTEQRHTFNLTKQ
jgi:hypothetical protein